MRVLSICDVELVSGAGVPAFVVAAKAVGGGALVGGASATVNHGIGQVASGGDHNFNGYVAAAGGGIISGAIAGAAGAGAATVAIISGAMGTMAEEILKFGLGVTSSKAVVGDSSPDLAGTNYN